VRNPISKAANAFVYLRRNGLGGFMQHMMLRTSDFYHDHRLGIRTRAMVATSGDPDSIDYMPIPYRQLAQLLRRVNMDEDCVFLDYGSGMGRVAAVAATYPIRRVIGVELSHELVDIARKNLGHAHGIACHEVEFVEEHAAEFEVPDDVSVIHFYNPFVGQALARVVDRIQDSIKRQPRRVQIIFFNHDHFDLIVSEMGWIRKTFSGHFYSLMGGALYETLPSAVRPRTADSSRTGSSW